MSGVDQKFSRFISLDAFRGFTIMAMLLVNNTVYDQAYPSWLRHAGWGEGVTFCDLIFPWFLFCVGVAIPFSAAAYRKKGNSIKQYLIKSLRRSVVLVILGVLIDCSISRRLVIKLDVLQLIGLSFLIAAIIYHLPEICKIIIPALFLIIYWILIRWIPFDGYPSGTFLQEHNIVSFINQNYLGKFHLSGFLPVFPAAALVTGATFLGDLIRDRSNGENFKLKILCLSGILAIVLGIVWNLDLEFNKAVWTPSFILFSGGLAAIILAFCYFMIEVKGYRKWAFPFVVFGMNAIAAYVVSIMVRIHTIQEWQVTLADGSMVNLRQALFNRLTDAFGILAGSWIYTTGYILFWWCVMFWMYHKKIFWKI